MSNTETPEKFLTWLQNIAIEVIDETFGAGYHGKHPELLGAYVQALAVLHVAGCPQPGD